jgi:hypothetical protein
MSRLYPHRRALNKLPRFLVLSSMLSPPDLILQA